MSVLALTDSLAEDDGVGVMAHAVLQAWRTTGRADAIDVWLARGHPAHDPTRESGLRVRTCLPFDGWSGCGPLRDAWERLRWRASRRGPDARAAGVGVVAFKEAPHACLGFAEARRRGWPFVSIVHGTYAVRAVAGSRHRARTLEMLRGSRATLAVSAFTRERLAAALGTEAADVLERVHVVPHGSDPRHLQLPVLEPDDPPYVVTVAACKERKGLDLACAALEELAIEHPALRWRIAGREHRETPFARTLRQRIARGPLAGRVIFEGRVDEERKVELLRRARVHLFTPRGVADGAFEGFGLPFLEAAALGVPSVGTSGCGAEQALQGGALGALVPPEPRRIAEAVRGALALRGPARAEHAQRLRERVGAWTWNDVAEAVWTHLTGSIA